MRVILNAAANDHVPNQIHPNGKIMWCWWNLGTKWCGAGDIAAHVWDLGTHHKTDRCCREHDFCFDVMPPRTCKYGLCNNSLFTK